MPNKSRGRGRGRNQRNRAERRIDRLQKSLNGYVFAPTADPRSYVNTPWNTIITVNNVTSSATGWATLDYNSIRAAIRAQAGLVDTTQMDCRLQWIKFYMPTYPMTVTYTSVVSTSPTYLPVDSTLAVKFLDPESGSTLATSEDYGTKTIMGRVGYYYPQRCRRYTIKNSVNPTILTHDSKVSPAATMMVQVCSLWQGAVTDPNPTSNAKLILIDRYGKRFPGTCDPDLVSEHDSDEDSPEEAPEDNEVP